MSAIQVSAETVPDRTTNRPSNGDHHHHHNNNSTGVNSGVYVHMTKRRTTATTTTGCSTMRGNLEITSGWLVGLVHESMSELIEDFEGYKRAQQQQLLLRLRISSFFLPPSLIFFLARRQTDKPIVYHSFSSCKVL